jgi:hypothetical protein
MAGRLMGLPICSTMIVFFFFAASAILPNLAA